MFFLHLPWRQYEEWWHLWEVIGSEDDAWSLCYSSMPGEKLGLIPIVVINLKSHTELKEVQEYLSSGTQRLVSRQISIMPRCNKKHSIFHRHCCLCLLSFSHFGAQGSFLCFTIIFTDGRTPWTGDQPVASPLPKHRINTYTHQTSMLCVGFEHTIPASEWAKTVHALDHSATVTGSHCHQKLKYSTMKINVTRSQCLRLK
jgi:hypothetical protein